MHPDESARTGHGPRHHTRNLENRPEDLGLPGGIAATLCAVGLVYVRRLWPLLVSITVPLAFAAPPTALLLSFPGHVIANGLPVLLDDPDAWRIAARGVLTVAALAGAAVGLGAAVTLGSAALMGRDVPVAAAWRIGLRRLRTLVVWTAGTGALTAATLWTGMVRFTESDIPPPFAMLVLLPPYLLLMAVWCVALSAALLEGRGLVDAVRRAWELGTTRRTSHAVLTSACVATAVLAVTGTEIAVGAIVGSGGDQLLALAARGALLTLAVPLVLLLLCAPGVHASPDSPWYLDLARVDRRLTAAGNTVWPVPRATVPVLAVAVALPTVAPPLATALSPNITPQLVSEPLDLDGADAGQMTISEDGTTVHFGDDLDTAELRETHGVADQYRSAPAPLENGVVVTTYVDPHHRMEEEGPDHLDGLRAHVCEDAACTDPREVDLDEELEQTDRFHRDEHARGNMGLDVAASPDGGFSVTVQEPDSGSFTLIHCADTACSDPVTTELTRQINASTDADTPIEVTGSSIEYRPDGTPVIAHTDAQQSGTHLVDCHDAACTESTSRVLTGSPYAWTTTHAPPGLAIDSQGVPHVATADLDAWKLVLVSCLDLTCSEHTTVPLSGFGEQPRTILLGLDGQDRPRLVWGPSPGEEGLWHTGRGPDGEYLWCTEPRCGAPGSDQGSAP